MVVHKRNVCLKRRLHLTTGTVCYFSIPGCFCLRRTMVLSVPKTISWQWCSPVLRPTSWTQAPKLHCRLVALHLCSSRCRDKDLCRKKPNRTNRFGQTFINTEIRACRYAHIYISAFSLMVMGWKVLSGQIAAETLTSSPRAKRVWLAVKNKIGPFQVQFFC